MVRPQPICRIQQFRTSTRYISQVQYQTKAPKTGEVARTELDSHADTIVAGKNFLVLNYTERSCDVSPYSDEYAPMTNVPIVQAATGYTSVNGRDYILIVNEALSMPNLDHSLINPNQLRCFNITVQDNPFADEPMAITSQDDGFTACLLSRGTTIYLDTWCPSQDDLERLPKIVLSSPLEWNPQEVRFPQTSFADHLEVEHRNIMATKTMGFSPNIESHDTGEGFNIDRFNRRVIESVKATNESHIANVRNKTSNNKTEPALPITLNENELEWPPTFLSHDRHSNTTPEDLSERWGISVAQAALTLKATTRRLVRSALMPLARRYRVDRIFDVPRLRTTIATDTMDARSTSIHGDKYCQVFGSKQFFVEAYPIRKKGDCHEALKRFIREYGAPDSMVFDGSKEQNEKGTKFQALLRKYQINPHTIEPDRHNQNPAESVIRELRKKWYRTMFKTNCPIRLWSYGIPHIARIMSLTASFSGDLDGRTPVEYVTGETPDISEYLDFGFYDRVWYRDDAGLGETKLGRFLGISHQIGTLMSYWILTKNGSVESRTTVQRVTVPESSTEANLQRFKEYDEGISARFKGELVSTNGDKPNLDHWEDWVRADPDFAAEFSRIGDNPEVPEADDTDTDSEDFYLHMELALDRGGPHPEFARVVKRARDNQGKPIGKKNSNPILDSRMYEVQYHDGHRAIVTANTIAENLFAQVDEDGNSYKLMDQIVQTRTTGEEIPPSEAFFTTKSGIKRRKCTTKGWECLIQWKDGTTTWSKLKDVKDSYPIELAEYAVANQLSHYPVFAWWVPYVLKKRDRIVSKIKSKYWIRTHKYGIKIPKTVKEAIQLDKENGNTLWWDALMKEMKNVRPAFEVFEGSAEDLPVGYQLIKCHVIWDVKLGENFRRKARLVAGGHTTETPTTLTYSSVVSRESVRIALTIAALNGLEILACDIQNAYLTAKCRERIYTIAGPEFGTEEGTIFIVRQALYGLKSSGAAFRSKLANVIRDAGFRPSMADPDVWIRPAMKHNGEKYYEMVLCYVDDVLSIGHDPIRAIDSIKQVFKLKEDKAEVPDVYLGATLEQVHTESGDKCWTMSSVKYLKAAIANVEQLLERRGQKLPTRCPTPMTSGYHPSEDSSRELDGDEVRTYQEHIGVLRWAVEIGRVDILLEVALLSTHLALPREGHMEQVYHIFGYLKGSPRRRIFFDPTYPAIGESRFQKFDWEDFYNEAQEPIPLDLPPPRGKPISIHCFVDASHAADKVTRRSQTGVIIFCNRAPIVWYSKRQNSVETSTFGAEFAALKLAVELTQGLRYKLRMFGVPLDGPANLYCDNEAVYKNVSVPESILNKKHHSVAYHACRQAVAAGIVRVAKEDTHTNIADLFTKTLGRVKRESLLDLFMY